MTDKPLNEKVFKLDIGTMVVEWENVIKDVERLKKEIDNTTYSKQTKGKNWWLDEEQIEGIKDLIVEVFGK